MNREIRFRLWDTVLKTMMPDFDNWIDFHGNYWTTPDERWDTKNTEIVRGHNYILMQFTGLHDKNGKEIYEGDIIQWGGQNEPMVVAWSDKYASFGIHRSGWMYMHFFGEAVDNTDCEVIGNIYQNPELIKQLSK